MADEGKMASKLDASSVKSDVAISISVQDGATYHGATGMTRDNKEPAKVADRITLPIILVILVGGAERFAYYANPRYGSSVPGVLGLGQATATSISNSYLTFAFLTPIPMGLVSDLWLGRYKTLLLSFAIYLCGCLVQFITSLPKVLDRGSGAPGLAISMILIGLGSGGVRATFGPFLGDQYVPKSVPHLKRSKNREFVVDKGLTLQLIYQISYWVTNIACLSSIPSTFLERLHGFWAAFSLALASLCVSVGLLVACSRKLVHVPPQGNIIRPAISAMICAAKSGFHMDRAKAAYQLSHFGRQCPWSDEFIEEIKMTLRTCRLLLSIVLFYLCIGQMANNFISQAGQMRLSGIPNDMITSLAGIFCIILGPLVQAFYGLLARRKIVLGASSLITLSFVFCGIGMAYVAGIQHLIYSSPPCYTHPRTCPEADHRPNDVSVWTQTPAYAFLALAEIFGFVTVSEYTYTHSPAGAKAIVQALSQLSVCLGSALSLALSPAAHDPNMVIYYATIAGAMGISAAAFWYVFGGRINDATPAVASHAEKTEP